MTIDDLTGLIGLITDDDDRRLIGEALVCLKARAYRAAYIMTWLAAAESLKRRIAVVAQRDSAAGKVLGKIEDGEKKHFAVDSQIVDGAFKIGLIDDIVKTRLNHIFTNRNIFGHPYNTAPNDDDVISDIRFVIEAILASEIKLKHSYVDDRLHCLLNDPTYLDDDEAKVSAYAIEVVKRVADDVHGYLFKKYLKGIKDIWEDPEKRVLRRRGMQFCKTYLTHIGVDKVVVPGQWLDLMSAYPEIMSWLASWQPIFEQLDASSKDSAVLKNIEFAKTSSGGRLRRLNELGNANLLNEQQENHLSDALSRLSGYALHATGIPLRDLYLYARADLVSCIFAAANAGADFFFTYRVRELPELSDEQQSALGEGLCDAARMNAFEAVRVVARIAQNEIVVPENVRIGYCRQFFTEKVMNDLQRQQLCCNSISIMRQLSDTNKMSLLAAFKEETNSNPVLSAQLKTEGALNFMEAYNAALSEECT